MSKIPLPEREDYERLLDQEASQFPRATREAVARLLDSSLPEQVQWVAKENRAFPEDLMALGEDTPQVLVYEGELSPLNRQVRLVIAGSRHAPEERVAMTRELAKTLALHGIGLISGLVSNIDDATHEGAMAARADGGSGSTAIVSLPFGAPWPQGRHEFANRVAEDGGLIISLAPQVRGLSMNENERLDALNYRQRFISAIGTAALVMYTTSNGNTEKIIREMIALERPVLLWHEVVNEQPTFCEDLIAKAHVDRTGRALVQVVHGVDEIEEAISAWRSVWWL